MLRQHNQRIGRGLKPGKIIAFKVGDRFAYYKISTIGESVCYLEWTEQPILNHDDCIDWKLGKGGRILTKALRDVVREMDFWCFVEKREGANVHE